MERFAGKVAIVTGSGSGLGRAIAVRLATEGARVVVADIDAAAGARTVDAMPSGADATVIPVDVSEESAVQAMVTATLDRYEKVDILVNNAAALGADVVGRDGDLLDLDVGVWDRTMAVNVRGMMLTCKHTIPVMLRSGGGSIVNISSAGAYRGGPVRAAYGTSKAAIVGLTLYVATMYGRQNVRCNAVAPGHMVNPETAARETGDFQAISAFDRLLPDAATPDDVAAVAVFLASDDARAVTGQTYVADGGRLAMKPSYAIELSRSG